MTVYYFFKWHSYICVKFLIIVDGGHIVIFFISSRWIFNLLHGILVGLVVEILARKLTLRIIIDLALLYYFTFISAAFREKFCMYYNVYI